MTHAEAKNAAQSAVCAETELENARAEVRAREFTFHHCQKISNQTHDAAERAKHEAERTRLLHVQAREELATLEACIEADRRAAG